MSSSVTNLGFPMKLKLSVSDINYAGKKVSNGSLGSEFIYVTIFGFVNR